MPSASVSVKNADNAIRSAAEMIKRLEGRNQVLVGVQKGAGSYEDGTLIAVIASANHFGATIKHKGGTSYGYKSRKDAEAGKVRFLKSGEGFMELGKTKAAEITIPARPFLDAAIAENQKRYSKIFENLLPKVINGNISTEQVLNAVGEAASSDVQEFMVELKEPANAPSTIAKKGSNNPLIDTGHMRQSIRHEIAQEIVTEGL